MRVSAVARAVSLVGLGAAGLVGGHAIGYALAVPDVHHRSALVAQTGHGYLPSASWAAAVLGLGALVAALTAGYLRRGGKAGGGFRWVSLRLMPLQVGAFVALEVLERLIAGAPLGSYSPRLAVIGVLTQVLVSLVGTMLLVGLRRAGAALARQTRVVVRGPVSERLPTPAERPERLGGLWIDRARAPPARASA
jgi:hypothetical protein